MMVNKIYCATQDGLDSKIIEVEATFTRGLPTFNITGLASSSIKESQHRVTSALVNLGIDFPPLKLNVNLSPSDLPKNGSHFDLPIALLVAASKESLILDTWFAFGELGLDGIIKNVPLIYPMLLDIALHKPHAKVILPYEAKELYSKIPKLAMYFASNITDALEILRGHIPQAETSSDFAFESLMINGMQFYYDKTFDMDFSDVKNQDRAVHAALIAACGFHNILFEGSPGCGKSMIAKRMQYILPPLSLKEMIESVKLQAYNGQVLQYKPKRSFRSPHQSASKASILGSATQFKVSPGEIALAHNGIIFFDELPYFKRDILESLREPLENNQLAISRVHSKVIYDTSFLFIGAMNPCPCGNLLSTTKECRCKDSEIRSYRNNLSEPFLDRIDLYVQMQEHMPAQKPTQTYTSKDMQQLVFSVFKQQICRGQIDLEGNIIFNGKLSPIQVEQYCKLDNACKNLLDQAKMRFNLSYRGEQKIKKVARTLADMQTCDTIQKEHILEALSYRKV